MSIRNEMTGSGQPHASTVPLRIAACWGLGTFSTTTMLNGVSVVLLFFLVTYVKIEPVLAGALLFGSKLLDVVTDPPMGLLSDRTTSRWGRRRPYLFGAAFFAGGAFALLFNIPGSLVGTAAYPYLVVALVLYALSYTAFQVPYMAMPAELTDDYHERTRIMRWRVIFMALGNATGVVVVPGLAKGLGEDRAAYGEMGLIVGGIICATMLIVAFGTQGARQTVGNKERVPLSQQLIWFSQNRPLLVLMLIKTTIYIGVSSFTAVMLFFIYSVLKKGPEALAVFGGAQMIAIIAFTPVWTVLSKRTGKRPAYAISLLGFVIGLLSWLLADPAETLTGLAARGVFLGAFSSGAYLFGNSMLMDTFAYDYKITGIRREGVLSAAFSFVEKTSLAAGPLIIGALLSAMGFDKNLAPTDDQSASAVRAMYIGLIWIPVLSKLAAVGLLQFYKLRKSDL
jgi:GPH family glycoside/pentoside/hexuronide:cation symporter